jgi:hypothetical protein
LPEKATRDRKGAAFSIVQMPFEFKLDKKARDVFTDYANGKPTAGMTFINSYEDGKQSVLTKVMTPLTCILKNQYGYSILVVVDTITADELTKYDTMGQRLVPNGFTYKKLLNDDDKMYLKLKVKDDEFEALNFTTPSEYESVNLEGINLNVTFHMGIWLNFEKQTAGSFLKIVSINKV